MMINKAQKREMESIGRGLIALAQVLEHSDPVKMPSVCTANYANEHVRDLARTLYAVIDGTPKTK